MASASLPARPVAERGVFETMLVWEGEPIELDRHLERIEASVAALYGAPVPPDARAKIVEAARPLEVGRLRLTVAPEDGGGLRSDVRTAPVERRLVFPGWEEGIWLRPHVVPGGLGPHKWADRDLVDAAEAGLEGAVALLVDADGTVLEGSRGNVFFVLEGTLVTPPTDGRILPGVTRRRVLELATEAGLAVREDAVSLADARAASEAFLTGGVRGIEPVRGLHGAREFVHGDVTRRLSGLLRACWLGPSGPRAPGA